MPVKNNIARYIGIAGLCLGSVTVGERVASLFTTFNPDHWKGEVTEEKAKRVGVLDEIGRLGDDGVFSVQDLAKLHDGILASTMGFNYMDTDRGDVPAYDNPISPGDAIMGDLNVRYGRRFNTKGILADLRRAHDAGKPIRLDQTDLDERVKRTTGEIRATFTDPTLQQEDLASAEYRTTVTRLAISGFGGFFSMVLGYVGLGSLYNRRKTQSV